MSEPQDNLKGSLIEEYTQVFRQQWSPITAGIVLSLINILLFAYAKPWTPSEGFLNWGKWMMKGVGVDLGEEPGIFIMTSSVLNLSLIAGAALAAMISREFSLVVPQRRDLARSLFGAVLMGVGAIIGVGCTVGGFLSAYSALSMGGVLMMFGLGLGAYLGLKLLLWDMQHDKPAAPKSAQPSALARQWHAVQPFVGAALAVIFVVVLVFDTTEFTVSGITARRSVLILLGLLLGVVNQRSRFCFVRAFREPFMTGEAGMTKGAAVALLVGVLGFAIIKGSDLIDFRNALEVVNGTVWVGSLLGGLIFGVGMILSGGCGTGTLWRAGEGQIKMWLVIPVFALSAVTTFRVVNALALRQMVGDKAVYVPELMGWSAGLTFLLVLPVVWYLLAAWNERTGKWVIS